MESVAADAIEYKRTCHLFLQFIHVGQIGCRLGQLLFHPLEIALLGPDFDQPIPLVLLEVVQISLDILGNSVL
jgi:hypothetical protein